MIGSLSEADMDRAIAICIHVWTEHPEGWERSMTMTGTQVISFMWRYVNGWSEGKLAAIVGSSDGDEWPFTLGGATALYCKTLKDAE